MLRKTGLGLLLLTLLLPTTGVAAELGFGPERRKDQFPEESGRLLAPLPYSMPGIGEGFFLLGHFSNLLEGTSDLTLVGVTGDATGLVVLTDEVPLVNKHLFFRAQVVNMDKVQVNQYKFRDMRSEKDDYDLLDIASYQGRMAALDLAYYDRRLVFSFARQLEKGGVDMIRDADGNAVAVFPDPFRFRGRRSTISANLDLTDDYLDPRRGWRFGVDYIDAAKVDTNDADFNISNINASWYVPTLGADTLVLNYFQSDAHVRKKGVIDRAVVEAELGIVCPLADTVCQSSVDSLVDATINARRYGTAMSLGGDNRFRAYPQDRFKGAHVAFIGVEYRWNFVRESTPFNFYIWKDTHTGYQLAFFGEYATVSETWGDLWKDSRYVLGTGFRLVTASGSVYRADLGFGDEGAELSLFFFYPWKSP